MSYHNVRDKAGRFAKKKKTIKATVKRVPKAKFTDILSAFVLDDSGSMAGKVAATISGFNEVLKSGQLAAKGKLTLHERLATFGVHHTWANKVVELNRNNYNPNQGGTALWDAIGIAINKLELELHNLPKKSTSVNLNIFTDGMENASRTFGVEQIKKMIEEKQAKGWVITFLGAGSEAVVQKMSQEMGIFASNTMSYQNNSVGTQTAFKSVAASRSTYVGQAAKGLVSTDGFFGK